MFVVFEGIDGSGKTTLSDRVDQILSEEGVSVHHARPKGELKSRLAKQIREMARNPKNLTMSPHTELLLYLARDSQMIDTVIRPSLKKADVVIADRYVYSPMILCKARGIVKEKEIDKAVSVVARGLWPDLVVYCDVDIHTSNLRKKIDKSIHLRDPDDFGRKGLRGLGLRNQMRIEYLKMCQTNSNWFKVDNMSSGIEENSIRIATEILKRMGKKTSISIPSNSPSPKMRSITSKNRDGEGAKQAFYDYLNQLCDAGHHKPAVYHARSMQSDAAWELRNRYQEKEPELVAIGLAPLFCDRAIKLRKKLIKTAPKQVMRSLKARWADDNPDAYAMRRKVISDYPLDVAQTLGSLDTDEAWALRDDLLKYKASIGPVLAGLKRIDTPRAWQLRERYIEKGKLQWGVLEGIAGIDTEKAWTIRRKFIKKALPWVLLSLDGLNSEEAWSLREQYVKQATKLVIRSLSSLTSERAWAMRNEEGKWSKETLTTIKGDDSESAWQLRESMRAIWPQYAAKSVGMTLAGTSKGMDFLWELANHHPNNPEVAHYLIKALEALEPAGDMQGVL